MVTKVPGTNTTLRFEDVIRIRERIETGNSTVKKEADFYGVARETIRRLLRRETFVNIRPIPQGDELPPEAHEIAARLMQQVEEQRKKETRGDAFVEELKMPTNPMEE